MASDARVVVAAVGVIITLFGIFVTTTLIVIQLRLSRRQVKGTYRLALRTKSLSYSLYANNHLRDSRLNIEKYFEDELRRREPIPVKVIEDKCRTDSKLKSDIFTLLAHWENMCLAINADIADEKTAYDMVAGTLVSHVSVFRPFMEHRKTSNKRAYENLFEINRKWRESLEREDGTRSHYERLYPDSIVKEDSSRQKGRIYVHRIND